MKFFNIDFHISVILDLEEIFNELCHIITDISLSDHASIIGKQKKFIPDISNGRWINYFITGSTQQFSLVHPELYDFDGFISTYPPLFSILYLGYNKPSFVHIDPFADCIATGICLCDFTHPFNEPSRHDFAVRIEEKDKLRSKVMKRLVHRMTVEPILRIDQNLGYQRRLASTNTHGLGRHVHRTVVNQKEGKLRIEPP